VVGIIGVKVTLLTRLLVLVGVAVLPAIAIQAYNEFDLVRALRLEVKNHATNLAELAGAEQQQIVQGIRQVLIALSEHRSIKSKDGEACNAYLAALKQRFPAFLTVVVADASGKTFCDADNNARPVNVSVRDYFATVMKTGAFTVGEFSLGLQSGRTAIQFALPFSGDDRQIGGVIIATLSLDWLADYIASRGAPAGSALAIMDRHGTYLARYPDNNRFVGRRMTGEKNPAPELHTIADTVDGDGVERIVGYSALGDESGGLLVSFGLDKEQAFAESQRRTQRGISMIVLSTALAFALASLGARRFIHRPLGQLVEAANQWRMGEFARRVDITGKSELARVADAFNTMADALEQREQELSKAKEKAEESAARITMIFESTTDSVVIVDRDWRISYLNGPAWAVLGESQDLIGMNLSEVVPEIAHTELLLQLRQALSDQRPVFLESFCARRNVWYALNAFSSSQGIAIFLRDITEHKNALEARRLIEAQFHHSQKMESVGQLTGGIAHDFNNLLMVVSVNLELIEDAADLDRIRQYAAIARRAADRGSKLTAQLLAFSRRQVLKPKFVNANQLIAVFHGLLSQAVGAGCEIELQTDERLWMCHVDPALLETSLLNLALNARDAMPDGGVLKIETRNIIVEEGATARCPPGCYVRLSVEDTGCGMIPEVRDKVFEPFFTTKEVGKGTGLGLSMVYGFVRQSGGHIAVDTAPGAGTTIHLYLPKATSTPDAATEPLQPQDVPMGAERLLVVEDNEDLLDVTAAGLDNLGYRVSCARNAVEALRMLQQGQQFELMLSDIVMPNGMSGVELAREVRRLRPDLKILLTTGYAGDVLERHGAIGEFPIIDKPFRLVDLARRIHSMLRET
jgi:PAS domain S-box-containing protein